MWCSKLRPLGRLVPPSVASLASRAPPSLPTPDWRTIALATTSAPKRWASSSGTPITPRPPAKLSKHKTAKVKGKAADKAATLADKASTLASKPESVTSVPPALPPTASPPTTFAHPPKGIDLSILREAQRRGHLGQLEGDDGTKVISFTTADSYDLSTLLDSLYQLNLLDGAINLAGEALYLPRWSPISTSADEGAAKRTGEVFVFESGSFVVWGLGTAEARAFLKQVIRGSVPNDRNGQEPGWVEKERYEELEVEELSYKVDTASKTKMEGEVVVLSSPVSPPSSTEITSPSAATSPDLFSRLALSAAMARMTKLAVYEEQFNSFSEEIAGIPGLLMQGSEAPLKKTEIVQRIGRLHAFRQKINLEDENLLDTPDYLWEDAKLDDLYVSLCKALDFDTRLQTLNTRVDYAFQLQSSLMDLLNANKSHFLEWIIIALILVEVVIVVVREGHAAIEWYHDRGDKPAALEESKK